MKSKIGIMGGAFDPIHYGHLVIANEVLNMYDMEKIIFIPTGNPPHKKGPKASSWHRYLMTTLATMTNDKFEVSDIEIKSQEKSYTVNTIKQLLKIHGNKEMFFITGADAIIDLPKWHEPEELLKLCTFIAVNRPGNNINEVKEKIEEIRKQYNAKVELLEIPMLEISSTDLRKRLISGRTTKYLLPESVEKYIMKNNLYKGIENNIEEIKKILKHSVDSNLYNHCLRTMDEAEKLALKYNVNVEKVKIAALLHDCAKDKSKKNNNLEHSELGAIMAKEKYGVNDEDILNAIRYHTVGRENMTDLEKIIFIADKIEPSRNYEDVEVLRELAYNNIDSSIIKSIENTIEYVKNKNLKLDENSVKTLNYLKGGKF